MRITARSSRVRTLLSVAVLAIAVSAVSASPASALTYQDYWPANWVGGYDHRDGPRHTLKYNIVSAGYSNVCAGQLDANGNWAGEYTCSGSGTSVTKQYCQCQLKYPRVHNGLSSTQPLAGTSGW